MDVWSKPWCSISLRWFHVLQTPSRCPWLWSLRAARSLWVALQRLTFNVAWRPSYTPCTLELRLFSRETVLTLTPMALAMKLSEHFFCSNTLIVYLCSEVNCLYICNTKLINLREGDECSPPFLHCLSLPPGSSGASRPRPQGKPRGVFHMSNTTKILHFYLERAF